MNSELLEGQKRHKRKIAQLKKQEGKLAPEETEIGRISAKIKALLEIRDKEQKVYYEINMDRKLKIKNIKNKI